MSIKQRAALAAILMVVGSAVLTAGARASTTPTLSLDQSKGTAAGATANLGMDLKFSNSVGDSPAQLTIAMPPGLLANAAIDGGACLRTTELLAACTVGSGTVTALGLDVLPVTEAVSFDLVAPPKASDLAGLAVVLSGKQLGATAAIDVRPSGDPDGVGLTIHLVLPDSLDGIPISISQIDSTFDSLRYPSTCPSAAAAVDVSVDSYESSSVHSVSAPLRVTNCSALHYAPRVTAQATRGRQPQVRLQTSITESASDAPSGALAIGFPGTAFEINFAVIEALCENPAGGGCMPVGTATAVSPLYPHPLTAEAYLGGSVAAPTLTLLFPAPFPLTLVGTVSLSTRVATFSRLPDIPLTDLSLTLSGGKDALFIATCQPASGTLTTKLVDQSGGATEQATSRFRVVGCPVLSASTHGSGDTRTVSPPVLGRHTAHPSLSFTVRAGARRARIGTVIVRLPAGFGFGHRADHRSRPTGVTVTGAKVTSLSLRDGRLVIVLRTPAASVHGRVTGLRRSPR